jgi:hypothetical protein
MVVCSGADHGCEVGLVHRLTRSQVLGFIGLQVNRFTPTLVRLVLRIFLIIFVE